MDGTEKNPVQGFCQAVISRHAEHWPLSEGTLAEEFVNWLGPSSFLSRDALQELCRSKGVNLSFISLPQELRGVNCSYQDKREIVITEQEAVAFAHLHTLLHEFREILEHSFSELGYATLHAEDSLEVRAEQFAIACRMKEAEKELAVLIEMARNVEKKWARYFVYTLLIVFGAAYLFSCTATPQMEEVFSEAKRQRYVRT